MLELFKRKSEQEERKPWAERLAAGLARSREKLASALGGAFARRKLDEETLDELESALITADVGVAATRHLLDDLSTRWKRGGAEQDPRAVLKAALLDLLAPLERPLVVTDKGEYILDNRRNDIMRWSDTKYRFLKRQSQENPRQWVALVKEKTIASGTVTSTRAQ